MKNPNRNIVVEYKNKRARKGSSSLWGNLDLKSIAQQVEADAPQSPMEVRAQPDLPKPIERRTENMATKAMSHAEPVIEQVEEVLSEPKRSNIDASGSEEVLIAMDELQSANMVGNPVVSGKKPSVRRPVKKSVPFKREAANQIVAEPDIKADLSALEIENADLKRELVARLRMENRQLHKMLQRLKKQ